MRALALTLTCLSGDDLNDCCDEGFDDDNHDGGDDQMKDGEDDHDHFY